MSEALERNAHAKGISAARAIFDIASGDTESEAERIFLALLHLHGITGWTMQLTFRGWRVDIAFPDIRLAVEINGWAYHRSRDRFEADSAKAAMLAANGWLPLSFTWKQLIEDPEGCIAQVAAALARRRS